MPANSFRPFSGGDRESWLAIFDANCPAFFAPNERADYKGFLEAEPDDYEVCEVAGRVVAAFGLIPEDSKHGRLNWIMIAPDAKGDGLGSAIMEHVISRARALRCTRIRISASHKSEAFFARFGAVASQRTTDGLGPGMHRVDMALDV